MHPGSFRVKKTYLIIFMTMSLDLSYADQPEQLGSVAPRSFVAVALS
jgi:hypothetical protein